MKHSNCFIAIMLFLPVVTGCYKRNFFEDRDDPGLSRFTSRNYNVTSAYINNEAWVSGFSLSSGPEPTEIFIDTNTLAKDTLYIRWSGSISSQGPPLTSLLTLSLPVKNNFTKNDFLDWNNKIFPADTTTVTISFNGRISNSYISGSGNGKVYFVKIASVADSLNRAIFKVSGLFEGNIGSSVIISKGRFDYIISPQDHNLP